MVCVAHENGIARVVSVVGHKFGTNDVQLEPFAVDSTTARCNVALECTVHHVYYSASPGNCEGAPQIEIVMGNVIPRKFCSTKGCLGSSGGGCDNDGGGVLRIQKLNVFQSILGEASDFRERPDPGEGTRVDTTNVDVAIDLDGLSLHFLNAEPTTKDDVLVSRFHCHFDCHLEIFECFHLNAFHFCRDCSEYAQIGDIYGQSIVSCDGCGLWCWH
mmetsp:Transcript_19080/g.44154  ORF Transcript_19080/g.44154 Transcript_19080/m.44154 type:complete len:216 (-) Transcript_19080:1267-1914(-)